MLVALYNKLRAWASVGTASNGWWIVRKKPHSVIMQHHRSFGARTGVQPPTEWWCRQDSIKEDSNLTKNPPVREFFQSIPIPVHWRVFAIALSIFGSQSIVGFSENSQVITDFGILWEGILTQVLQFFFHYLPAQRGSFCLNAGLLRIAAAFAAGRNAGAQRYPQPGMSVTPLQRHLLTIQHIPCLDFTYLTGDVGTKKVWVIICYSFSQFGCAHFDSSRYSRWICLHADWIIFFSFSWVTLPTTPLLAGDFQIFGRPTAGIPSLKNWQRQPTAPRMHGSKAAGQGEGRRSNGFWKAENPTLMSFNTIIYNYTKHKSKPWIFCRLSQPKVAREFVGLLPMGSWVEFLISSPRPAGECAGTDSAAGEGGIWSHLRWGLGSDFFGMDQSHEIRMMKGVLFWVLTFGLFSSCTKGTALKEMKGESGWMRIKGKPATNDKWNTFCQFWGLLKTS